MIHKTTGTYRRFSSHKTEADIVQWANGSWPDGLPKKDGANALSGAGSDDTATTQLGKTSRTKNLIIEYYGNTIFLLRACLAFRGAEALGLSETILLREIFIKTIVDGGNNLLKDALFLLDERGWHIVWRLADLCLQQHFSFTNVDQDDFPQCAQGVVLKDETMPPVVIASCCFDTRG